MILISIRLENSLGMNQDRGKNALEREPQWELLAWSQSQAGSSAGFHHDVTLLLASEEKKVVAFCSEIG